MIHGLHAGEHDAQTGDVVQAGRALRVLRQAAAEQLFADGRGRFEPERHRADGEGRVFLLSCIRAAQSERNAVSTAAL